VFLPEARALPTLLVVRQPDGALHVVVTWRRHGQWVQLIDLALGRRWVDWRGFAASQLHYELPVVAETGAPGSSATTSCCRSRAAWPA
jgi:hypothetical protein